MRQCLPKTEEQDGEDADADDDPNPCRHGHSFLEARGGRSRPPRADGVVPQAERPLSTPKSATTAAMISRRNRNFETARPPTTPKRRRISAINSNTPSI